jgi:hypothetical protein
MKVLLLLAVACGVFLAATVQAKSNQAAAKQAPPSSSAAPASPAASAPEQPWLQMEISPLEKEIMKQHLADIRAVQSKKPSSDKARPPGSTKKMAHKAKLPPGWQKNIVRGAVLPQTVYAQAQPLPEIVIRKLPPPPAGTILVLLDGKVLRLLETTRTIVDVFELK